MKKTKGHFFAFNKTIIPVMLSAMLLALPLLPGYSMPPGKKVNFSGTWSLNEGKSVFGEYGRFWAPEKLIIVQKGKKLSMEKFSTGPSGEEFNIIENYTLNGKECENTIFEQSKKKSTATWSDDKKNLVINSILNLQWEDQEMEVKVDETYGLEDDGNSLVIQSVSSSSYGEMKVTYVYDLTR
jgi:hypothetical protein